MLFRVAWLVCVRTYGVPTATLNQNKRTRLPYLGDAQIIMPVQYAEVTLFDIFLLLSPRYCNEHFSGFQGLRM